MSFLTSLQSYNPFSKYFQNADIESDKKEAMSNKNSQGVSELQAMRNQNMNDSNFGDPSGLTYTGITWDSTFGTKAGKISKYREMSFWPEIDIAISQISDDAIIQDASGNSVNLDITEELPSHIEEQIRNKWDYLVNDVFAFNSRGWDFFRKWLVEAEIFIELILNDEGTNIIDIKVLPAHTVQPVYANDTIVNYMQNKAGIGVKVGSENIEQNTTVTMFDKDQVVYVHYGIPGDSILDVRGYLEPAMRLYNQIKNLEDSLIIARIARAPERRIWNIDVGKMPKGKAEEYLKGMIQRYRKRLIYNPETGAMDSTQNIQSLLEDYWFAKQEGSTGTTVDTIKGESNLGEITDINYFLKKLYMSLKLPRSRWDDSSSASNYSSGKSGEILREEIQFSKFVERLQRRFSYILMKPFLTLLKLSGIDEKYINEDLYNIKFVTSNLFKEYRQMELLEAKFGLLANIDSYIYNKEDKKGIFAPEFVLKHFLMMTDEELRENEECIQRLNGITTKKEEELQDEFNINSPDNFSNSTEQTTIEQPNNEFNNQVPNEVPNSPEQINTTETQPNINPVANSEITTNQVTAPESKSFGNKVKNATGLFSLWTKIDGSIKNKYSSKSELITKNKKVI